MQSILLPAPFHPLVQEGYFRRHSWLLPGALAIVFAAMVAAWASRNDVNNRLAFQNTLATDASSVEAQLAARQESERSMLREIARHLPAPDTGSDRTLAAIPEVNAGLGRLWNRLIWLNADHQIVATLQRHAGGPDLQSPDLRIQSVGQAEHLSVRIPARDGSSAGELLARYEITDLLRSTDLAWLNRRYEVSFLSDLDEVIATTADARRPALGTAYERNLSSSPDTRLVLRPYNVPPRWWQSPQSIALLIGLPLLGLGGSLLLRREMQRVARAVRESQTEAAWRQSMEDSALVGLRARDLEGRILFVNKTLCELVGFSEHELVGLKPPLPFWPPETVDAMMARNTSTLAGDTPTTGYETRWLRRDGQYIDVMVFESRLLDPQGAHIGWMGSIVDISARKALEERDRRHLELMAQHARLNDLGLLASELAHELNQPLAAVIGYSAGLSMAIKKLPAVDTDTIAAAEEIQRHARRAGDIVHWIRRQTSRSAPTRTRVDVRQWVTDVAALRQRALQRLGIQLDVDLPATRPAVMADRVGLEQVLGNLLRNAADALADAPAPRRVRVTVRCAPARGTPAERVDIAVADNGPGLGGKTIEDLCATFYTTKPQGMGLGLGICRSIIEDHGGELTADDAPGSGAVFRFTLPLAPPDTQPTPEDLE